MKPSLLLLFIFVISLPCFSQTADVKEGCSPLTVTFSIPPTTSGKYFWDFKDGVTSDLPKPKNIFTKPGTYVVSVQESVTGPLLGTITIKVYAPPSLNFTTDTGCAPYNTTFKNTSTFDPILKLSGYEWVFGDGQSVNNIDNPKHLYSNAGKYSILLSIKTQFESCNTKATFENAVEVIAPPIARFTTNPINTITCKDSLDITYTNTSITTRPTTYQWIFGNGKTSKVQNPDTSTHRYFQGKYIASLQLNYPQFQSCVVTNSQNISVGKPNPTILKSIFNGQSLLADSICPHDSIVITTDIEGTYLWNFGKNAKPTTTSVLIDTVEFKTFGSHIISLTVTTPDGQCSSTVTDTVYVDSVSAEILAGPRYNCNNPGSFEFTGLSNQTDVTYRWAFPDGQAATGKTASHEFSTDTDKEYFGKNIDEGKETWVYITTIKTGCIARDSATPSLWLPNALYLPNTVMGCAPLKVSFKDLSEAYDDIVYWKYFFGDGNTMEPGKGAPVLHTYSEPGEYQTKLIIRAKSGCIDTSYSMLIRVGDDLSKSIDFTSNKTEVCPKEEVVLTAQINPAALPLIEAYHFTTEGNRSFHCANEQSVSWSYDQAAGPQDVSLTVDYRGCMSTITKKGFINAKGAVAKIDYEALCSDPLNYNFIDSSKNAQTLLWDFGDGKSGTAIKEKHLYTSGDYTVKLTASNGSGCAPTIDTRLVRARQVVAKISIDTLQCIHTNNVFSASGSKDVFANCHTGYTWRFPGSNQRPHTSSDSTALFRFGKTGPQSVHLVTTDINGCKDTAIAQFKIFQVNAKASVDKNPICNPTIVQFSDLSTGDTTIAQWLWKFGDDSTSLLQKPAHTYAKSPKSGFTYNVSLIAKDILGCSDTTELEINQYLPTSKISINKNGKLCLGDSAYFTASDYTNTGSHLNFSWNFGKDFTGSSKQKNSLLYKEVGTYLVKLNYSEVSSGCIGSDSAKVELQAYPIAGFTTDVDTVKVLCAPQTVRFTNTSSSTNTLTYRWNFGNGQSTNGSDPTSFFNKGKFTTSLIASTSFGCSDTARKTFELIRPEGSFTKDKSSICKGDQILFTLIKPIGVGSYTWAFGDGVNLSDQSPVSHRFNFHPPSNSTQARLILRGPEGVCPVVVQQQVNIFDVIADFDRLKDDSDSSICFSEGAYKFFNRSSKFDGLKWDFGDGQTSIEPNPVHQYAGAGIYNVSLSVINNQLSCKDTLIKKAIVFNNPTVQAMGDTVCAGKDSVHLKIINPNSFSDYLWSPATGLSSVTSIAPSAMLLHSVTYQVTEKDTNGCDGKTEVPAIVIEQINAQDWDTTIIIGDEIQLPLNGEKDLYHYSWTPPDGLSCLDCNYPSVRPLEDILYHLEVTDVLNCFTSDFDYDIKIRKETFIRMPTTFTPNEDGNNDRVFVEGWGIKDLLEYMIFNRWGQMLYSSNDLSEGWDGKYKGQIQNSDAYVYKVKVRTWRDQELYQEGYINLVH